MRGNYFARVITITTIIQYDFLLFLTLLLIDILCLFSFYPCIQSHFVCSVGSGAGGIELKTQRDY